MHGYQCMGFNCTEVEWCDEISSARVIILWIKYNKYKFKGILIILQYKYINIGI